MVCNVFQLLVDCSGIVVSASVSVWRLHHCARSITSIIVASVYSAVWMNTIAIDSGGYLCLDSLFSITVWLNASQQSQYDVQLKRSARGIKCNVL